MRIILDRYYGDEHVTKSHMIVASEEGEVLFEGEAREGRFVDYAEKFKGCMACCVARGSDFRVDISGSIYSPMTFKLVKIPGRLSCCFAFDTTNEHIYNHINVGYADPRKPAKERSLKDVEKAKERLTRLAYGAFARDETVSCDVTNEHINRDEREVIA